MITLLEVALIFTILFCATSYSHPLESNPQAKVATSLNTIKNFSRISTTLASSGMPTNSELILVKESGYQHIISLIPGNFSEEQQQISALGMSFAQIAVDWHQPTLADFKQFVQLMDGYQNDKVLVHCRLNYRASAFAYLYQTTQLNVDEITAKQQMNSIWQPEGVWLDYINMIEHHYQSQ
ncbi:protein tyrosine phosphatase family protein [Thalassotalea sp. ND16A]|uniref:protein tyrosine phosphatase family protein n=1 Tax=Thalassotalea sp. ND16A TaxID=1535422 RepID=UPI00051D7DD3|nr:protein tyrosine phosphatase family protein [Thalassotalea sp. ND16A]KGJ95840.1 hypothetical protein ND16A_1375 [Thalassotalea sp. ND16A]